VDTLWTQIASHASVFQSLSVDATVYRKWWKFNELEVGGAATLITFGARRQTLNSSLSRLPDVKPPCLTRRALGPGVFFSGQEADLRPAPRWDVLTLVGR